MPGGVVVLDSGVISTSADLPLETRIHWIYDGVRRLLETQTPTVLVLEDLYAEYRFPRTAILMGHARGVIYLAARQLGVPEDRWLHWWGGANSEEEAWFPSERPDFAACPSLREAVTAALAEAALLHDIGKTRIPLEILKKPSALDKRERRMMEGNPERVPEKEDAEEHGPESTPDERYEEVLPEVPGSVFPSSKQPKAVDHPDEAVAGVAYHEAEEDWECERKDEGRVDLAVIRRREKFHEHLERSERLRIPEQDGRIRLWGRGFDMFGPMILLEFGHEQPREALEPALEFLEGFRRDPAFHDERVIRHGEPERRFRFLHRHLEMSLRGGEEAGVALSQRGQSLLDLLETGLPAFSLGEKV